MSDSSFGFDSPEKSPGFLLWQCGMLWQREIKRLLTTYNLSHSQFVILAVLLWFEETKQQPNQVNIIQQTQLDKMTVSSALKKLTQDGYIIRSENKIDTRAKNVGLTKQGKALTKKLVPMIENIDSQFFNKINANNQNQLVKFLGQLVG